MLGKMLDPTERDQLTCSQVRGHFRGDAATVHQRDPYIIFQIGESRIETEALKVSACLELAGLTSPVCRCRSHADYIVLHAAQALVVISFDEQHRCGVEVAAEVLHDLTTGWHSCQCGMARRLGRKSCGEAPTL